MYRFNIPVPPEEDFPEVIVAQRMGEGFKKEYVEYEPRWRFDKMRRIVVVDEKYFYAMADTSERLKVENTKLREYIERKKVLQDFARLVDENSKLRELVRDLWLTGSLCDAIPDMRLQAKGGDWRTMQERVDEALGVEVD